MITKDQYCWAIINKFKRQNPRYADVATKDLSRYVYQSTNLGIALQHLGYIDPDSSEALYLSNRGGIAVTYTAFIDEGRGSEIPEDEKIQILTTREILNMLPDTLEEKSND